MKNNNSAQGEERTILKLIQDIHSGIYDASLLDKATRQQCVEVFIAEGYTHAQLAQLLKCSEKTISRDMQEIRQKNSIAPSLEFAKETVGELITKARLHASYLMRLARDKDSPAPSKAGAEFLAWRVIKELTEKLQTLGYLPLKPQEVSGDIYHHVLEQEDESYEDVKKMIFDLEQAAKESGGLTKELTDEISELNAKIDKAEVNIKVKKLIKTKKETTQEDKNEEKTNT